MSKKMIQARSGLNDFFKDTLIKGGVIGLWSGLQLDVLLWEV